MIQIEVETAADVLEMRLSKGADLLFDMEQRGDVGTEYDRYLRLWQDLLEQYEGAQAA